VKVLAMNSSNSTRIAWIYPSISYGAYWQPVINEFTRSFDNVIFYTGCVWPGFRPDTIGASKFKVIGKSKYVRSEATEGYSRGFIYASPSIIFYLIQFKPHVIFASAFSVWTVLALLLKPVARWQVVIMYDGSSPNSDFQDSKFRTFARKVLARFSDAFIANSRAAEIYLAEGLNVSRDHIFTRTYLVPDVKALLRKADNVEPIAFQCQKPVFLFVGQVIARKGIQVLLEACSLLRQEGYKDYTLMIVGDGAKRQDLEIFVQEHHLQQQVMWVGWVEYGQLGAYFQQADVFVFPTYEDVWGMAVLEAMAFGKPILCSRGANASELVVEGENGYLFNPNDVGELAIAMRHFINDFNLIEQMSKRSQELIAEHTVETAAQAFVEVASFVMDRSSEKLLTDVKDTLER
jgi:glycosyltransferase involved in cell wall biosynthesis